MVGLGFLMLGVVGYGLWLMRKRRLERAPRYLRIAFWSLAAPFLANTTGWIFTEMGRQPWVVYGLLKTSQAVSHVSNLTVGFSLVAFTLTYSILAVVEIGLIVRLARHPLVEVEATTTSETDGKAPSITPGTDASEGDGGAPGALVY